MNAPKTCRNKKPNEFFENNQIEKKFKEFLFDNSRQENFSKTYGSHGFKKSYSNDISIFGQIKADIFHIRNLIKDYTYIINMYKTNANANYSKDFLNKIEEINFFNKLDNDRFDELINKDFSLPELQRQYNTNDKNELILLIEKERELYRLFILKLNHLFLLLNLNLPRQSEYFQQEYKATYSKFNIIQEYIKNAQKIPEDIRGSSKILQNNSEVVLKNISLDMEEKNDNDDDNDDDNIEAKRIETESLSSLEKDIEDMDAFQEFLDYNLSYDNKTLSKILSKIKSLFYVFNKESFSPLLDFIIEKIEKKEGVKIPLVEKIRKLLSSNGADLTVLNNIRQPIEQAFENLTKENNSLKAQLEILEKKLQNVEKDKKETEKKIESLDNLNFKKYLSQVKEENMQFFEKIKRIIEEQNRKIEKLFNKKFEMHDELKIKISTLEEDMKFYKRKVIFNENVPYRKEDSYYQALREQFEDMKERFTDMYSDLSKNTKDKINKLKAKITGLEDEKKTTEILKDLLIKKVYDLEKLFEERRL